MSEVGVGVEVKGPLKNRVRMSQIIVVRRKGSIPFDSDDYELDRLFKAYYT
jgi:hypothetical protein